MDYELALDKIYRLTSATCQPCKMLAKNLETACIDVPVEVVDIDVHTDLVTLYGIRSVPVLIALCGDIEVGRLVGMKNPVEIDNWVDSLK